MGSLSYLRSPVLDNEKGPGTMMKNVHTLQNSQKPNWNYSIAMTTSSRVMDVTNSDVEWMILDVSCCNGDSGLVATKDDGHIHGTLC